MIVEMKNNDLMCSARVVCNALELLTSSTTHPGDIRLTAREVNVPEMEEIDDLRVGMDMIYGS